MRPLRFGIAGCGGIAGLHAECLQTLAGQGLAQLVVGFDRTERRRTEFGAKWNVPMVASLDELLKRDDVEAVIVTTPSGTHGDFAIQIAKAGRHILVEKPLDVWLDKADAAIAAAKKAGVTLGGVSQQRFIPAVRAVKRAIDAGYFGQIVLVHCETPWYRTQAYFDSADWRGTWAFDGGVLANQGTHMIDRLLWLGGDVAEVLSATLECGRGRDNVEIETLAVSTIRLTNGALGTITGTTLAYDGLPQRAIICGTEGSCAFSGDELVHFKTIRPIEDDALITSSTEGKSRGVIPPIENHLANVRDFVEAVRDGRPPLVTGEEQRRVVRAIEMIYEKARVGPFAGSGPLSNVLVGEG